jgi:hypothetical protein
MWATEERDYGLRKTGVYLQVLAMGKKTDNRFHHKASLCSQSTLAYITYTCTQHDGKITFHKKRPRGRNKEIQFDLCKNGLRHVSV